MGDDDCRVLQEMWQGLVIDTFIEINKDSVDWEDAVDEALAAETDTLIMAGHGTSRGLLFPDYYRESYIVHMGNVHLIKAKNVICTWCHASAFCTNHNLHSFSTSMFISNVDEAVTYCVPVNSQQEINLNGRTSISLSSILCATRVPVSNTIPIRLPSFRHRARRNFL